MLQVRNSDMFQTAYQQLSAPERSFVDRLVREIAEGAKRHGARVADIINAPMPQALLDADNRGWLDRPLVRAAITEQLQHIQLRQDISLDRVAQELHALATFSLEDIMHFDATGDPYFDLENATPEQLAAIKTIEVEKPDEHGVLRSTRSKYKIQTHDKLGALKMLLDLLGGNEAENPYRKAASAKRAPALTDDTTSQQAADEYARYISDE